MNKVFKVIWNNAMQNWVIVSEVSKSKGKTKSFSLVHSGILTGLFFACGQVLAITGTENQSSGNSVNYCYYNPQYPNGQIVCGSGSTQATGFGAIAIGNGSVANSIHGNGVVAIGINSKVDGASSVTLGAGNIANASYSNAIGYGNFVNSNYASVLGFQNRVVTRDVSGAFGQGNQIFNSDHSYAFGVDNIIGSTTNSVGNGLALGRGNNILGSNSISIGGATIGARESNAIGRNNIISSSSEFSTVIGSVIQIGASETTITKGNNGNHTVTYQNQTRAPNTVAIGNRINVNNGGNSIAIGANLNVSNGSNSISLGKLNTVEGSDSITTGVNNKVNGYNSIATGRANTLKGNEAFALGSENIINNDGVVYQFVNMGLGKWNTIFNSKKAYALGLNNVIGSSNHPVEGALALGNQNFVFGTGSTSISSGYNGRWNDVTRYHASIIGGANSYSIGTYNVLGSSSSDSVLLGNSIRVGASNALVHTSNDGNHTVTYDDLNYAANTVAVGRNITVNNGTQSIAVGDSVSVNGASSIAMGNRAKTSAINTIAVGQNANASGIYSTAIGTNSVASNNQALALGYGAQATNQFAVSLGVLTNASGNRAIALGADTNATGDFSTAIGRLAKASETNAIAIGRSSNASHENSVVLGSNSVSAAANPTASMAINGTTYKFAGTNPTSTVSVGRVGSERQIVNVAAGRVSETSTDAINGSQLYAFAQQINNNMAAPNTYFHVNDGTNGGTGNATTNLGGINDAAGAQTKNSITIGIGARTPTSPKGGESSIAIGTNAVSAHQSVVLGANATNEQENSVVIGTNAKSVTKMGYSQATAVGFSSTAANDSVAIGSGASATGHLTNSAYSGWGTAVGRLSNASGRGATAVGNGATASGIDSIAFGSFANVSGFHAYSFGYRSNSSGSYALAFGDYANATGSSSMALGAQADSRAPSAIALGNSARAMGGAYSAIALGNSTLATEESSIAFGNEAEALVKDSVALGARSYTGYLADPLVGTSNATVNGITYGNFAGDSPIATVSVGNTNEKRTITNVAAGRILANSTDAINGSQLYMVASKLADEIANVTKKITWYANATANSDGTVKNNNTPAEIGDKDTVTLEAGKNITITQDGKKFTIEAKDSGSNNVNIVGGKGINVESNSGTYTITAKTDGTTIIIDSDGNIAANTGTINTAPQSGDGAGVVTVDDSDKGKLATVDNVANAINSAGWIVNTGKAEDQNSFDTTAQTHSETTISAGKRVNFKAGKNMEVKREGDNIIYATSDNVSFNKVTVGDTEVNNNGVTIKNGPSMTIEGINAGNKKITNVAPGEVSATSTEAVNGSQLYAVNQNVNNINNRVNKVDKDLRAGIAGAAAIAGLPQVRGNGKSMVAVAASNYRGENAVALGYTRASDNGKVLLKLSGSSNTRGDVVSAVGVGYEW
ncbi:YadA-like family protein [Rodentibacter trehalosifermentans]|uniref:YadA-like family protein n=1 Tax=Rodentibacter trehalosifermentans TaxID=1908263 RepID=UPI0009868112|nr:YadA-like family protein [Rodentibacter trehalosifermentans]OOF52215.1 hypothetical protein BKK53_06720 [Rodentibacter trehalosifermentans]